MLWTCLSFDPEILSLNQKFKATSAAKVWFFHEININRNVKSFNHLKDLFQNANASFLSSSLEI